ncbi:MAG: hypothetical protein M5Z89_01650 [Olivibacter sp.]|nr:hypothetical protein [Olivibacter sp. UJ_SKK_5.1]
MKLVDKMHRDNSIRTSLQEKERVKILKLKTRTTRDTAKSVPAINRAEALVVLAKLIEYRDHWNMIDGFTVNWDDTSAVKWCISMNGKTMTRSYSYTNPTFLYFGNQETRDHFFHTYRELIDLVKLLY